MEWLLGYVSIVMGFLGAGEFLDKWLDPKPEADSVLIVPDNYRNRPDSKITLSGLSSSLLNSSAVTSKSEISIAKLEYLSIR